MKTLFLSTLSWVAAWAFLALAPCPAQAWDKTFNTPTATATPKFPPIQLKDGTPDYLSTLTGGPTGPVFLIPNLKVEYGSRSIQYQAPPQYLKVTLVSGQGRFEFPSPVYGTVGSNPTPTPTPDPGLKADETIFPLGEAGAAPILFYPSGGPGSSYRIQVTCPGHPEAGVLDYAFTIKPEDKAVFDQFSKDYAGEKNPAAPPHYRTTNLNESSRFDYKTGQLGAAKASTVVSEVTKDSSIIIHEDADGKPVTNTFPRHAPAEKRDPKGLGDPWGEDAQNLIFYRVGTGGSKARDGKTWAKFEHFYNFTYLDKATHQVTRMTDFMCEGSYSINIFGPRKPDTPFLNGDMDNCFYGADGKKMIETKISNLKVEILP
jgi:hypothetical protein